MASRSWPRPCSGVTMPGVSSGRARLSDAEARATLGWDKQVRGLVVPDAASIALRTMSASTVNSVMTCPARWAGEKMLSESDDPFKPTTKGSACHTVLEKMFTRFTPDNLAGMDWASWCLDELAEQSMGPVDGHLIPEDRRLEWVEACREAMGGYLSGKIENPADVRVVGLELPVNVELDGIRFTGFIDRITEDEQGQLWIEDYKTSKSASAADDNACQQQLYAAALSSMGGVAGRHPVGARLIYLRLGETHPVDTGPVPVARALARLDHSTATLRRAAETNVFPASANQWCRWCRIGPSCPSRRPGPVPAAGKIVLPVVGTGVHQTGMTQTQTVEQPAPVLQPQTVEPLLTQPTTVYLAQSAPTWPSAPAQPLPAQPAPALMVSALKTRKLMEGRYANEMCSANGGLNPGCYAVDAIWDLASYASFLIDEAGLPSDGERQLTLVLADLSARVQRIITGKLDWNARSHTTARRLVKHVIRWREPIPFGGDPDTWRGWAKRVVDHCATLWDQQASLLVSAIEHPDQLPLICWDDPARQWAGTRPEPPSTPSAADERQEEEN